MYTLCELTGSPKAVTLPGGGFQRYRSSAPMKNAAANQIAPSMR